MNEGRWVSNTHLIVEREIPEEKKKEKGRRGIKESTEGRGEAR